MKEQVTFIQGEAHEIEEPFGISPDRVEELGRAVALKAREVYMNGYLQSNPGAFFQEIEAMCETPMEARFAFFVAGTALSIVDDEINNL